MQYGKGKGSSLCRLYHHIQLQDFLWGLTQSDHRGYGVPQLPELLPWWKDGALPPGSSHGCSCSFPPGGRRSLGDRKLAALILVIALGAVAASGALLAFSTKAEETIPSQFYAKDHTISFDEDHSEIITSLGNRMGWPTRCSLRLTSATLRRTSCRPNAVFLPRVQCAVWPDPAA